MGQFDPKFQIEGDAPHQPFFVSEKLNEFSFYKDKNVGRTFVLFVTIHACDGQHRRLDDQKDRVDTMQRGNK